MSESARNDDLKKTISRRDFIDWIIKGGLLATFAGMLLPALTYLWPATSQGPSGESKEIGNVDDIPLWGGKKVILAGKAIFVIRTPNGIKAFSAICTHLGCIVDWDHQKHWFHCPCHAGTFDMDGKVVSGPPPKNLPVYNARVVDGKIYVTV